MTAKCTRAVDGPGWSCTLARHGVRYVPPVPPSPLLRQGPTSPARTSSASALRPSRCGPPGTLGGQAGDLPVPEQGASVHAGVYDHAGSRRVLAITHPSMLPSVLRDHVGTPL